MPYQVFDNDKPADSKHHTLVANRRVGADIEDLGWNNSVFDTFEAALEYAWMWLGPYGGSYDGKTGYALKPNERWDYSGYGDFIEIRVVDED